MCFHLTSASRRKRADGWPDDLWEKDSGLLPTGLGKVFPLSYPAPASFGCLRATSAQGKEPLRPTTTPITRTGSSLSFNDLQRPDAVTPPTYEHGQILIAQEAFLGHKGVS
jgi:hypothetical protein